MNPAAPAPGDDPTAANPPFPMSPGGLPEPAGSGSSGEVGQWYEPQGPPPADALVQPPTAGEVTISYESQYSAEIVQQSGWQPPAPSPVVAPQLIGQVGDISIYSDRVVTPSGTAPIHGLVWTMRDTSTTTERISPVGIVLAILFFLVCLIGLLFLLMKETTTTGYVEVSVSGDGFFHLTQIPITDPGQVAPIRQWVDYARSLSQ